MTKSWLRCGCWVTVLAAHLPAQQQQQQQQPGEQPLPAPPAPVEVVTALDVGSGVGGIFQRRLQGRANLRRHDAESAAAIDRGIAWLCAHQHESGAFGDDADDLRATSLALLVLLADGSNMRAGPHKEAIRKAVKWLRAQLREDGVFGEQGTDESVATQAMATTALVETFALSVYKLLQSDAQRALTALAQRRDAELYMQVDRDPHAATWYVEACRAAAIFGLEVDKQSVETMVARLHKLADAKGGPAGAAEAALWCAWLAVEHEPPAAVEALTARVAAALPQPGEPEPERWLDASYALFQVGGEVWQAWLPAMRTAVLGAQVDDGSWPAATPSGDAAPRTCATARACLTLAVSFRFARQRR